MFLPRMHNRGCPTNRGTPWCYEPHPTRYAESHRVPGLSRGTHIIVLACVLLTVPTKNQRRNPANMFHPAHMHLVYKQHWLSAGRGAADKQPRAAATHSRMCVRHTDTTARLPHTQNQHTVRLASAGMQTCCTADDQYSPKHPTWQRVLYIDNPVGKKDSGCCSCTTAATRKLARKARSLSIVLVNTNSVWPRPADFWLGLKMQQVPTHPSTQYVF